MPARHYEVVLACLIWPCASLLATIIVIYHFAPFPLPTKSRVACSFQVATYACDKQQDITVGVYVSH